MPAKVVDGSATSATAAPSGRGSLMDGKAVAAKVRGRIAGTVKSLAAKGVTPGLSVVLVGDDPASAVYVRNKAAACAEVGMHGETIRMPATTSQVELEAVVDRLNGNPEVHGILVQMPLPKQLDSDAILHRIDPAKDVDGFHPVNVGRMLVGDSSGFVPCTPAGVMELLREYKVRIAGAHAVVIGRSNIVGKPMMALLVQPGTDATVTVCHSRTRDMAEQVRRADIVVAAAGKPRLVTGDMVKPGAVVIDVGINRIDDPSHPRGSRIVGDVDFDSVSKVASLITPVPGGVGPMTIAMLLANTLRAAERRA